METHVAADRTDECEQLFDSPSLLLSEFDSTLETCPAGTTTLKGVLNFEYPLLVKN